ncbi:hypothetical protein VaNZ11_005295, partial [Volvox africanus]
AAGVPPTARLPPRAGSLLQPKTTVATAAAAAAAANTGGITPASPQPLARWDPLKMRQRLPAGHGCLHACALGTAEPLAPGAWIPTSMMLPLAVLLQALAADGDGGGGGGLDYVPPSVADVR